MSFRKGRDRKSFAFIAREEVKRSDTVPRKRARQLCFPSQTRNEMDARETERERERERRGKILGRFTYSHEYVSPLCSESVDFRSAIIILNNRHYGRRAVRIFQRLDAT